MNGHEQARELITLAGGRDLSGDQQKWLQAHLQECASCGNYAEAVRVVVSALRSRPLAADFALVESTKSRVRSRALELQRQQQRVWLVCLSCLFVGFAAAITTPLFWQTFEWVAAEAGIVSWIWQAAFAFFWIAPALVVSTILLARGTHLTSHSD